MAYSGKFIPKNPSKYRGDITNITWRSTWELRMLKYLDENPNVLEYASEEIVIPYLSPLDNKVHRYFVDLYAKIKSPNGVIKKYLIEVKPHSQTIQPQMTNTKSKKTYIRESLEWIKNNSKWAAAKEWCAKYGMEFIVLTEKEIFNK